MREPKSNSERLKMAKIRIGCQPLPAAAALLRLLHLCILNLILVDHFRTRDCFENQWLIISYFVWSWDRETHTQWSIPLLLNKQYSKFNKLSNWYRLRLSTYPFPCPKYPCPPLVPVSVWPTDPRTKRRRHHLGGENGHCSVLHLRRLDLVPFSSFSSRLDIQSQNKVYFHWMHNWQSKSLKCPLLRKSWTTKPCCAKGGKCTLHHKSKLSPLVQRTFC